MANYLIFTMENFTRVSLLGEWLWARSKSASGNSGCEISLSGHISLCYRRKIVHAFHSAWEIVELFIFIFHRRCSVVLSITIISIRSSRKLFFSLSSAHQLYDQCKFIFRDQNLIKRKSSTSSKRVEWMKSKQGKSIRTSSLQRHRRR